jgi:hypothetical protein
VESGLTYRTSAAVCTVAGAIVHVVAVFFLRKWFGEYGNAYGAFGIALALIAAVGIIASFWVWIAAVMGVYWERPLRLEPADLVQLLDEICGIHLWRPPGPRRWTYQDGGAGPNQDSAPTSVRMLEIVR